jgi:hypothetical protein
MNGQARPTARPLWQARFVARAPRLMVAFLIAVLCISGLRSAVAGRSEVRVPERTGPTQDLGAESFAEAYARTYLTWDAAHPDQHDARVSAFVSDALDPGAGLALPARGTQAVLWTAVSQDRILASGHHLVTVAVETSSGPFYLSVPVDRDGRGFMFVSGYPALVGAPAVDHRTSPPDEPDVQDPQLEAIARRVIANYLSRDAANLRADLDSGAVVALPPTKLDLASLDAITWAAPGRVAGSLHARGRNATWTLRYELEVVKRDRWYVRSIQTNPTEGRSG